MLRVDTSQWHHEALKLLLILTQLHHQQPTKSRVERRPTMHVDHRSLHVVHAEKRKMITLQQQQYSQLMITPLTLNLMTTPLTLD